MDQKMKFGSELNKNDSMEYMMRLEESAQFQGMSNALNIEANL